MGNQILGRLVVQESNTAGKEMGEKNDWYKVEVEWKSEKT